MEKGITYAPDYVINEGGLIIVWCELKNYPRAQAMEQSNKIFDTVKSIIDKAKAEGISTIKASNIIAEQRIEAVAGVKRFHLK
jgi:leucine dehydrogenase